MIEVRLPGGLEGIKNVVVRFHNFNRATVISPELCPPYYGYYKQLRLEMFYTEPLGWHMDHVVSEIYTGQSPKKLKLSTSCYNYELYGDLAAKRLRQKRYLPYRYLAEWHAVLAKYRKVFEKASDPAGDLHADYLDFQHGRQRLLVVAKGLRETSTYVPEAPDWVSDWLPHSMYPWRGKRKNRNYTLILGGNS